jgi:hypothetical protein
LLPPRSCNYFQQKTSVLPSTQLFFKRTVFNCLQAARLGWGRLLQKRAHHEFGRGPRLSPELASASEGIMTSTNVSEAGEEMRDGRVDLDGLYGEIGILALVAALRYASDGKNPAYAPKDPDVSAFEVSEAA